MRDRALAMKWAEEFVAAGNDADAVANEFKRRGVKDSTTKDQLRRLRRQGLLPDIIDQVNKSEATVCEKPFSPVPKSSASGKLRSEKR